jgi:GNAT superfamily N-acetyltransferase
MSTVQPREIHAAGASAADQGRLKQAPAVERMEIVEVQTRRDLNRFLKVPESLHGGQGNWIPPLYIEQRKLLDPRTGPFYQSGRAKLWLAVRDGKAVGRMTSHVSDRYDAHMGGKKGFFGFFACEDNANTAGRLFDAAQQHLLAEGRDQIEGPFSFTVYDELGILVDGFETPPAFMVTHNPPYYADLLTACGFEKAIDWYAYRGRRGETDTNLSPRLVSLVERLEQQSEFELRPLDKRNFKQEAALVKDIFDQAWERNWGHVPMSESEFWSMAEGLKQLVVPGLSCIVAVAGKPVGLAISIYDINPIVDAIGGKLLPFGFLRLLKDVKKMKRFRMLLMGVLPRHRGRGYEVAMYVHVIRKAAELGFDEAEMSLIVESNAPMIKSIENLSSRRCKTVRIFTKSLGVTQ